MSESKIVIERNADGDYELTQYGEFLAYYHTHVQLFGKLIQVQNIPESEKHALNQQMKNFIITNIKKAEHFAENTRNFAGYLSMGTEDLTKYLTENFFDVFKKVKDKLKEQEVQKRLDVRGDNFDSITEEIIVKIGDIFPDNHRFVIKDGLLILEDIDTGEVYKPTGMIGEIYQEKEKYAEKLQERLHKKEKPKLDEEFIEEVSVLQDILDKYGKYFTAEILDSTKFDSFMEKPKAVTILDPVSDSKPRGVLEDVPDLEFENDSEPEMDNSSNEYDDPADHSGTDIMDLLDQIGGNVVAEDDPVDKFLFKDYSEIKKTSNAFKKNNDVSGYNAWVADADSIVKAFVQIRNNINKEQRGDVIQWKSIYSSLADKINLKETSIDKLHTKIVKYDSVYLILEETVNEIKQYPPEILSIMKACWIHVLKIYEEIPDFVRIEKLLKDLLSKIKSEENRKVVFKILAQMNNKIKSIANS